MIRTLSAVLLLASTSGAMATDLGPYSTAQTLEMPVLPGHPERWFVPAPTIAPPSDLDRAKAVCDGHQAENGVGGRLEEHGDVAYQGTSWMLGWIGCRNVQDRWDQSAAAKAAAAAAEQERQDHALVDRVAAGK